MEFINMTTGIHGDMPTDPELILEVTSLVTAFVTNALKTAEIYVNHAERNIILAEDINFKPNLAYFLQVKLVSENGLLMAYPITGNGSGDLASLVKADAFIQVPSDKIEFKKGEVYPIIKYRE